MCLYYMFVPPLNDMFETTMAWYSLCVLKMPLNTHQPTFVNYRGLLGGLTEKLQHKAKTGSLLSFIRSNSVCVCVYILYYWLFTGVNREKTGFLLGISKDFSPCIEDSQSFTADVCVLSGSAEACRVAERSCTSGICCCKTEATREN